MDEHVLLIASRVITKLLMILEVEPKANAHDATLDAMNVRMQEIQTVSPALPLLTN